MRKLLWVLPAISLFFVGCNSSESTNKVSVQPVTTSQVQQKTLPALLQSGVYLKGNEQIEIRSVDDVSATFIYTSGNSKPQPVMTIEDRGDFTKTGYELAKDPVSQVCITYWYDAENKLLYLGKEETEDAENCRQELDFKHPWKRIK